MGADFASEPERVKAPPCGCRSAEAGGVPFDKPCAAYPCSVFNVSGFNAFFVAGTAHVIGSRQKLSICKDHGLSGCTLHRLSDAMRARNKDHLPWQGKQLLIEVPPQMNPGFEHTLKSLVLPAINSGTSVAVFSVPDGKRQSQRHTWLDIWNKVHGTDIFRFVRRGIRTFVPDSGDNRQVYVASTCHLPDDADSDSIPTRGTTCGLFRRIFVLLVIALLILLGAEVLASGGRDQGVPGHTRLSSLGPPAGGPSRSLNKYHLRVNMNTTEPPSGGHELQTQQAPEAGHSGSQSQQQCDRGVLAFPTEAKQKEKERRKMQKEAGNPHVAKKRAKIIEDHFDDCGEDLASLGSDPVHTCRSLSSRGRFRATDQCRQCRVPGRVIFFQLWLRDSATCRATAGATTTRTATEANSRPTCASWQRGLPVSGMPAQHRHGRPDTQPHCGPVCLAPCCSVLPRVSGMPRQMPTERFCPHATLWRMSICLRLCARHPCLPEATVPHEVVPPDTSEPTARLAPIDPDGRPMGTADEERVAAADRAQRGEARGCRSAEAASPDTVTRSSGPAEYRPAPPPPPDVMEVPDDAADGRGQDGPRRAQRPRHADAAVGEAPQPDWTHFDIGNSVRALRTNNEAVIRRVLRKLHVRWWHASAQTLTRMLHRAGVPQKALDLVPSIVHSCTVCREWSRPGPTSASNSAIPDRFNEQVECDLIFISGHTILHMLDRCTRWHAAEVIPNKEAATLINGISRLWFQTHGPPKELIMDGEGGISGSDDAKLFLNHHGVRLVVRPKDTHARYIERRGAIFRDCVHRLVTQCNVDGLNVPFERVLAEAVFAGNALLTVNGSTPVQCRLWPSAARLAQCRPDRLSGRCDQDSRSLEHTSPSRVGRSGRGRGVGPGKDQSGTWHSHDYGRRAAQSSVGRRG